MSVILDLERLLINDVVEEVAAAVGVVVDPNGRLLETGGGGEGNKGP